MSSQSLTIGIIEDNRMTQAILKSYLQGKGHKVVGCAVDYDDALAMVEVEAPELVFLDIQLLTSSGFDVLRDLRKNHPNTTVIMLSGYATPALMTAALARGAVAYLLKPFDYETIDQALNEACSMMMPLAA